MKVEDRPDYFDIQEMYAERLYYGYKCLVPDCGKIIEMGRDFGMILEKRSKLNMGNARGAMTNHLKGHMRRGEI